MSKRSGTHGHKELGHACLLFFLLLVPNYLFLNNELIWDDQLVFTTHTVWSLKALLGPYGVNSGSYWRPVTQLLIGVPFLAGTPIWAVKLIGLALFFAQGCLAMLIVNMHLGPAANRSRAMIFLALLLALHPAFVETSLWISARADLLIGMLALIGIYWLLQIQNRQKQGNAPETAWLGFLRGFILSWLICGAKDSGVAWAGLGLLAVLSLISASDPSWKKYWWHVATGTVAAVFSYLIARFLVLGGIAESEQVAIRAAVSFSDQSRFFCEFLYRSLVNIFLPYFDRAPFKSSGWFDNDSSGALVLGLCIAVILFFYCMRLIFAKSKLCAWLILCASIVILFHAVVETFIEPTQGSVLAARYLAPSAMLIFIAITILMAEVTKFERPKLHGWRIAGTFLVALMVAQSLLIWTESRESWTSNLNLWKHSWDYGSRSRLVASNLSVELMNGKKFQDSIGIARYWIDGHEGDQSTTRLCSFYDVLLKDYISVHDEVSARDLAQRALPVGWCYKDLAQNIAFVLMKQQCQKILPMLLKTMQEGEKLHGEAIWNYVSVQDKINLVSLTAYTEARCGSEETAMRLLAQLEMLDKNWEHDGPLAQSLLIEARKNRTIN